VGGERPVNRPVRRALVLQHIGCEPPGVYEDVLVERGVEIVRIELDEGGALEPWNGFDLTIVMGGPMGAYELEAHPWLCGEIAAIGDAARAGHPVWGVCLGAQILAASLGAVVHAGPVPEVGVLPVSLTAAGIADVVFGAMPVQLPVLQWHGDTFELPAGATLLATSPAYAHQAFRFERSYALQFHLEVSRTMASEWAEVPAYREALDRVLGEGSWPHLRGALEASVDEMSTRARTLFERWLDHVVR
jgi:GMP synthase (glutamine-hydrolysing)